jgi:hypothetical protein
MWNPVDQIPFCLYFIKNIGNRGVDIFMFLSGIGMTYAISKETLPVFYYRRAKRLLPTYLLIGIPIAIESPWSLIGYLAHVSGYIFYRQHVFEFLWFVPAIGTIYLFYPLFYRLAEISKAKITFFVGVIVAWAGVSTLLIGTLREDLYVFTNRIPVFVLGTIVGLLINNYKIFITKQMWVVIGMINIVGLYLAYLTKFKEFFLFVPYSQLCIPGLLIAISASLLSAKLIDILSENNGFKPLNSLLGLYGSISIEFYCIQEYLISKVFAYKEGEYWWLKAIILLSLNTIIAWMLHKLFNFIFSAIENKIR